MEYYLVIKRYEVQINAATWINLKNMLASHKRPNSALFHLYEYPELANVHRQKVNPWLPRGGAAVEMGSDCSRAQGFFWDEMFWNRWWLHNPVNVLKTTELYTLGGELHSTWIISQQSWHFYKLQRCRSLRTHSAAWQAHGVLSPVNLYSRLTRRPLAEEAPGLFIKVVCEPAKGLKTTAPESFTFPQKVTDRVTIRPGNSSPRCTYTQKERKPMSTETCTHPYVHNSIIHNNLKGETTPNAHQLMTA